jgi:hypothetical protein
MNELKRGQTKERKRGQTSVQTKERKRGQRQTDRQTDR